MFTNGNCQELKKNPISCETLSSSNINLSKNLSNNMYELCTCNGITYLLPKNDEIKMTSPKNFSPITCLTATYKLFASILNLDEAGCVSLYTNAFG